MTEYIITKSAEQPIAKQARQKNSKLSRSFVLKACIFATGLAGIVAEYVIATAMILLREEDGSFATRSNALFPALVDAPGASAGPEPAE